MFKFFKKNNVGPHAAQDEISIQQPLYLAQDSTLFALELEDSPSYIDYVVKGKYKEDIEKALDALSDDSKSNLDECVDYFAPIVEGKLKLFLTELEMNYKAVQQRRLTYVNAAKSPKELQIQREIQRTDRLISKLQKAIDRLSYDEEG